MMDHKKRGYEQPFIEQGAKDDEATPRVDFAWDEVEHRHTITEMMERILSDSERVRGVLHDLTEWLHGSGSQSTAADPRRRKGITTRVYAMLYTLRPEWFSGSLEIAAQRSGAVMAELKQGVEEFRARFGHVVGV